MVPTLAVGALFAITVGMDSGVGAQPKDEIDWPLSIGLAVLGAAALVDAYRRRRRR